MRPDRPAAEAAGYFRHSDFVARRLKPRAIYARRAFARLPLGRDGSRDATGVAKHFGERDVRRRFQSELSEPREGAAIIRCRASGMDAIMEVQILSKPGCWIRSKGQGRLARRRRLEEAPSETARRRTETRCEAATPTGSGRQTVIRCNQRVST